MTPEELIHAIKSDEALLWHSAVLITQPDGPLPDIIQDFLSELEPDTYATILSQLSPETPSEEQTLSVFKHLVERYLEKRGSSIDTIKHGFEADSHLAKAAAFLSLPTPLIAHTSFSKTEEDILLHYEPLWNTAAAMANANPRARTNKETIEIFTDLIADYLQRRGVTFDEMRSFFEHTQGRLWMAYLQYDKLHPERFVGMKTEDVEPGYKNDPYQIAEDARELWKSAAVMVKFSENREQNLAIFKVLVTRYLVSRQLPIDDMVFPPKTTLAEAFSMTAPEPEIFRRTVREAKKDMMDDYEALWTGAAIIAQCLPNDRENKKTLEIFVGLIEDYLKYRNQTFDNLKPFFKFVGGRLLMAAQVHDRLSLPLPPIPEGDEAEVEHPTP